MMFIAEKDEYRNFNAVMRGILLDPIWSDKRVE